MQRRPPRRRSSRPRPAAPPQGEDPAPAAPDDAAAAAADAEGAGGWARRWQLAKLLYSQGGAMAAEDTRSPDADETCLYLEDPTSTPRPPRATVCSSSDAMLTKPCRR